MLSLGLLMTDLLRDFQRDTLEIVALPNSVDNSVLEETVCDVFKKIGVEIDEWDGQAYHCLKEKEGTIVKFVNKKYCLQILRVMKELKSFDPTFLSMKVYILIAEASGINE